MKDNKYILKFQIFSVIFAIILGTLLHFTYEWSNNNQIVALVSSINESTWEHLKLIFFPMLITIIIGYFIFKERYNNFLCSKTFGIIVAISFTVIFFYTYKGILGYNIDFLNITSFFIAIILGEYIAYKRIISEKKCNNTMALIILILLSILFLIFTYNTPMIGLFRDPITWSYGIEKASK